MDFLRRLFGGPTQDEGLYFYVQPKACKEIVQVRLNAFNDLSLNDEGNGYLVRKQVRGRRCPFPAEITLYFDKQRRLTGREIEQGEWATAEDYTAWQAEQQGSS